MTFRLSRQVDNEYLEQVEGETADEISLTWVSLMEEVFASSSEATQTWVLFSLCPCTGKGTGCGQQQNKINARWRVKYVIDRNLCMVGEPKCAKAGNFHNHVANGCVLGGIVRLGNVVRSLTGVGRPTLPDLDEAIDVLEHLVRRR